jgi:outer membrane lipoprotein-sorting protein
MSCPLPFRLFRHASPALAVTISLLAGKSTLAQAPAGTVEPVHRVANAAAGQNQQPAQVAARIAPPAGAVAAPAESPFDLTQLPGEHPLMPALRVAQEQLKHIDANIQDYSALLYKQERIDGELQEQEVAFVKVRHQPFSVHMFFLSPNKGRECLYVAGPNGEKSQLHARDSGFRKKLGVFKLDPDGRLAMAGQKYPITKLGIRNLTTELVEVASNDVNYGECEVRTLQTTIGTATDKRPVTVIEVVHPTPRKNFRFHKAQVFIDNELGVPIRYAAYLWPQTPGGEPPLEEAYTYLNLKVNNGFTDADFNPENPELFKN